MSKEEKHRLRVLNIYDHNTYMRLDKERDTKRFTKVYKEINKEREEWRASIQCQKNEKQKRTAVVIIQKYTCKWMARRVMRTS